MSSEPNEVQVSLPPFLLFVYILYRKSKTNGSPFSTRLQSVVSTSRKNRTIKSEVSQRLCAEETKTGRSCGLNAGKQPEARTLELRGWGKQRVNSLKLMDGDKAGQGQSNQGSRWKK